MSLTPFDQEFDRHFYSAFNRLLDPRSTWGDLTSPLGSTVQRVTSLVPRVNERENETHYFYDVDLPGMAPEDVVVEENDGVVTVTGERKKTVRDEKYNYVRTESSFSKFTRTLTLPENTDATSLKGSYKDGVLTLAVDKTERPSRSTRRIAIE